LRYWRRPIWRIYFKLSKLRNNYMIFKDLMSLIKMTKKSDTISWKIMKMDQRRVINDFYQAKERIYRYSSRLEVQNKKIMMSKRFRNLHFKVIQSQFMICVKNKHKKILMTSIRMMDLLRITVISHSMEMTIMRMII